MRELSKRATHRTWNHVGSARLKCGLEMELFGSCDGIQESGEVTRLGMMKSGMAEADGALSNSPRDTLSTRTFVGLVM